MKAMFSGRVKHFPNFGEYLDVKLAQTQDVPTPTPWVIVGAGVAAVGFALITGWYVVAAIAGAVVLGAAITGLLGRGPKKSPEEVKRERAVRDSLSMFESSARRRKLHRELDPTAAQLLEACSYYWLKIQSALLSPAWNGSQGAAYTDVKEQALAAANRSMEDALMMTAQCLGRPSKTRQDDLKALFQDFADLELDDALKGIRRIADGDVREYSHHSPNIHHVFEPVRHIAENLKLLASELEQTAARATAAPSMTQVESGRSLESVLSSLREIRTAEEELEQRLRH